MLILQYLLAQLLSAVQSYFILSDIVSTLFNLALHIQEKGLAYLKRALDIRRIYGGKEQLKRFLLVR